MSLLSKKCEQDYKQYITQYKSTIKKCVPLNTSGRSKQQIVADMEATLLRPYIVSHTQNEPRICGEGCKCQVCFNKELDRILALSEKALQQ